VAQVAYLSHRASLLHGTGGHPESAARIEAIEQALAAHPDLPLDRVEAPAADRDLLTLVHPPSHLDAIERLCDAGGGWIDPDTMSSGPGTWNAAVHAAGGAAAMADLLLADDRATSNAFSCARPPGHHAEPERAMGFCFFNNVAIAARRAQAAHGVERVLILDWDVHHGNGTAAVFADDPSVLFISIHQWPLWPGTGAAADFGRGDGLGHNVNVPVPIGTGDAAYASIVEHLVAPLARAYRPALLLVSAGFDAHRDDPLANCAVTEAGYVAMTESMLRLGAELEAPLGAVLEGGYDLGALSRSMVATLATMGSGPEAAAEALPVHPLAAEALGRAARYWPELEDRARTSVT